jgi:hypothetical protein
MHLTKLVVVIWLLGDQHKLIELKVYLGFLESVDKDLLVFMLSKPLLLDPIISASSFTLLIYGSIT